jgi:NAD(P)-dependent dehydrogenase (short-subunit alcohol dehydrogenase family)
MPGADVPPMLREGLLAGTSILLAPASPSDARSGPYAQAVEALCAELGAKLAGCQADAGEIDVLVVDAAALFAAAAPEDSVGGDGDGDAAAAERAMLVGCLQASWELTHAVANEAFLARGRAGRILYIAPAPGVGAHAEAARAGLENLARTLSIEWARHRVTPVTIAPGAQTAAAEVAVLCAYLASPAGAYFSGCLLDLRGPGAR